MEIPENIDLTICAHCNSIYFKGHWVEMEVEDLLPDVIREFTHVDEKVDDYEMAFSSKWEDARNLSLSVEFRLFVSDLDHQVKKRTRVRLKKGVCERCSRIKGKYYESILQIRGEALAGEKLSLLKDIVLESVNGMGRNVFLGKMEEVRGGLDFYLSSKPAAKSLASRIRAEFGGRVTTSSKVHGRKDGREAHRMTYLVRLPWYDVGSVLKIGGRILQIIKIGDPLILVDLVNFEQISISASEVEGGKRVECERKRAIILSRTENELQILDPERLKTVTIRKPPILEEGQEYISFLVCGDDYYPSFVEAPVETSSS